MKTNVFPLVYVISLVHSFSIQERKGILMPTISTQLESSSVTDGVREKESQHENWTLDLDWILQDTVPHYTVVPGSNIQQRVTFWNQLKHAIPEFKSRSDEELEHRYRFLNTPNTKQYLMCGPAPPILTDWWVDDSKNLMGGLSQNGSTIWFYTKGGGRLGTEHKDHISRNRKVLIHAPGGFAEASDGSIYELGPTMISPTAATPAPGIDESHLLVDTHARKMVLLGITLSSILSAILAFLVGQQMPLHTSTTASRHISNTATIVAREGSSPSRKAGPEVSIQEQRARQELKILREKRVMATLQEKVQQDEVKLSELQKEETRQEGAELGFY
eukprot:CAMPEP_0196130942 /NCGR_PEP_ID=MMETSP0910-20130528/1134_1 /TAXON_ID=49265 /ORGANISM="Thalassiosira rotula, Strain GSO102" /LENGTH=331 /DNA_ID=CAMNT_0041390331 /DNA_START=110 /DNA_END=1105 /DNA_ORIENTATION=-